jgi:hypothetical protein
MKSGYSIDLFLLKKFQSISDWIQDYFGYDNFVIARFLRTIMITAFIFREVIACIQGIDVKEVAIMACSITIIVKIEYMLHSARESLKNKHELMNSAVVEYATTRIIMLLIATTSFGFFLSHLYSISTSVQSITRQYNDWKELCWDTFGMLLFLVAYFNSCTPKPYKPGKLKKFAQNTVERMRLGITPPAPKTALL